MLWVLKRTVSMRRFFWAPKTYSKSYGKENICNFTLKSFVYLNLWSDVTIFIFMLNSFFNIKPLFQFLEFLTEMQVITQV